MMPFWLKVMITLTGLIGIFFSKYKCVDPKFFDILYFVLFYGFWASLIFLPWRFK